MAERPLTAILRQRIAMEGPLALDDFWRAAMTTPEYGYYMRGQPIGAAGDFTTAPEISQIFGELIGLWLVACWDQAGRPERFDLVELGPGRGQLMADALRAARMAPEFRAAARLVLGEASRSLQKVQAEKLADANPTWREDWREALAGDAPMFLVGNEFLDALPIRQFQHDGQRWRERRVAYEDGFVFIAGDAASPSGLPEGEPPEGAIFETAPEREEAATAVARRLARTGGAALLVDYGHGASKLGDSLQALQDGRPADPLAEPGAADVTSHVDFASLIRAAAAVGARGWGPVEQGTFLLRLGAEARAAALQQRAEPEAAAAVGQGLRRLVHPLAMGGLFKALALTPMSSPAPAGFEA